LKVTGDQKFGQSCLEWVVLMNNLVPQVEQVVGLHSRESALVVDALARRNNVDVTTVIWPVVRHRLIFLPTVAWGVLCRKEMIRCELRMGTLVLLLAGLCGAQDAPRKLKRQVEPHYPELAKRMGMSGSGRLQLLVAPDVGSGSFTAMGTGAADTIGAAGAASGTALASSVWK
jgi:hypothetical protein